MIAQAVLVITVFCLVYKYLTRKHNNLPGPGGYPFFGATHLIKPKKTHLVLDEWAQKHGQVYSFTVLGHPIIVVSGFEAMYEMTVKKGAAFGNRPDSYSKDVALQRTGILTSSLNDERWKMLRKTSHKHLKQFGDGLSRLENIIQEVAEDMFTDFNERSGIPYDPKQIVFDTALNSIAFLITGVRTHTGDSIVAKMKDYEVQFLRYLSRNGSLRYFLLDVMPWLRFLNIEIWQKVMEFISLEKNIWEEVMELNKEYPDARSLCKILMEHADSDSILTETDARRTSMNLLLAGVTTTSNTFYAAINILAHHPDIQDKILDEIHRVCGEGQPVTLAQRPEMHYSRAFIHELLRYTSVVAVSVAHSAGQDGTIQGHFIPKGTRIQANIYGLHHEKSFWKDPEAFRPDRFLDEDGILVAADHPNRKHLMPFGAGTRVCLGETLALTRLFLWTTTLVSRYSVRPAPGTSRDTLDTRNFVFEGVLRHVNYQTIFTVR